jgi:V/A-type H+-transporting ATPase subunit D
MTKAAINKSSLAHQRRQLRLFQRFLPSLDLKRQQLLTERKEARRQLADAEQKIATLTRSLTGLMEPLGAYEIDLHGLVTVDSVVIEEENIVGARLPVAREVKFKTAPYAMLGKPFWVDFLVEYLQQMCILRVHLQVRHERVVRLNQQVRKITQRVNLFEKVLVPKAKENIKRIRIGLAEQERSAVVRSKIAKKKRALTSRPGAARESA